jgi:hypothetical protein
MVGKEFVLEDQVMRRRMVVAVRLLGVLALLLALCASVGEARTFIVNPDTTGYLAVISMAADSAQPGDSIMVRDGTYWEDFIAIDSAVVVFAEHNGGPLVNCVTAIGITLHQSAQLSGMQIVGNFMEIMQSLVEIHGGPATIYNCQFWPTARQGLQVSVFSSGRAPVIRYCQFFTENGASPILEDWDTTTIWMPYNYYQRTDTVAIHWDIRDASHGLPNHGYVYVSPVLDSFEWLGVDQPRQLLPVSPSIGVFPNPFNTTTQIEFTLPTTQRVSLRLYDVLGREVAVMMNEIQTAGKHRLAFDAAGLASGVYWCRLEAGGMIQTRKIVLLK